jgi:hypothetical protein
LGLVSAGFRLLRSSGRRLVRHNLRRELAGSLELRPQFVKAALVFALKLRVCVPNPILRLLHSSINRGMVNLRRLHFQLLFQLAVAVPQICGSSALAFSITAAMRS